MNLIELNERHPLATSIVGGTGSLLGAAGSWYLEHMTQITTIAAHISAVGGTIIFLGTLGLKGTTWIRRRLRNRWQRMQFEHDTLP